MVHSIKSQDVILRLFKLPYALLRARQTFMAEANKNPADFDENLGRGKDARYKHPSKLFNVL
jgi:hypothetical protein